MKHLVGLLWLLMIASGAAAAAQSNQDEDALRNLPRAFCEAWAKHDGHDLAMIMAEDVDFVTAEKRKGTWLVITAQNTNGGSWPPELQGIKPPIVVPRAE